jgi:hypothetical protein
MYQATGLPVTLHVDVIQWEDCRHFRIGRQELCVNVLSRINLVPALTIHCIWMSKN